MKAVVAARRGERDEMQDAHVLLDHGLEFPHEGGQGHTSAYYGMFDGHGGARAAEFCAAELHKAIAKRFPEASTPGEMPPAKEIKKGLIEAFHATDREFLAKAADQHPIWRDGSTACVILAVSPGMPPCI